MSRIALCADAVEPVVIGLAVFSALVLDAVTEPGQIAAKRLVSEPVS